MVERDAVAVPPRVEEGVAQQRVGDGLRGERQVRERRPVRALELRPPRLAGPHDPGHVDLHHRPRRRNLPRRPHHMLGDGAPHRRQRHLRRRGLSPALLPGGGGSARCLRRGGSLRVSGSIRRVGGGGVRRRVRCGGALPSVGGGGVRRRVRFRRGLGGAEDVLLGDAGALAGAAHRGEVDAVQRGEPRDERRDDVAAVGSRRARGRGLRGGKLGVLEGVGPALPSLAGAGGPDATVRAHELERARGRRVLVRIGSGVLVRRGILLGNGSGRILGRRWLLLSGSGLGSGSGAVRGGRLRIPPFRGTGGLRVDVHLADGVAHRDGVALGDERADEDAVVGRGRLHRHLVGHHLDEGIVPLDALAGLDEPLADDALGYGFADVRQLDGRDHG